MARGFLIGDGLLGQIKDTIRRVDGMPEGGNITRIPTRFEGVQMPASKTFRICTFTGAWGVSGEKVVTFRGVTTTPNTVSAVNLVCGLSAGTAQCDVSVAKDGTAWYLVQVNFTQLPGYSSSGTHVLTVQSGVLRWVGTTVCQ